MLVAETYMDKFLRNLRQREAQALADEREEVNRLRANGMTLDEISRELLVTRERARAWIHPQVEVRALKKSSESVALAEIARRERKEERREWLALRGVWGQMVQRCTNPNVRAYAAYGGRGITVYEPWIGDFPAFYSWINENIGPRPTGRTPGNRAAYSLDRIDVDGNYEPGNLRWADWKTQHKNKRKFTRATYGTHYVGPAKFTPSTPGVYALLRGRKIVYVGQSQNMYNRVVDHVRYPAGKEFNCAVALIKCDKEELNDRESDMIHKYHPEYNFRCPTCYQMISDDGYFLSKDEIKQLTAGVNRARRGRGGSNKYTGVKRDPKGPGWEARFNTKYLGTYNTEIEAAQAYNNAAAAAWGADSPLLNDVPAGTPQRRQRGSLVLP